MVRRNFPRHSFRLTRGPTQSGRPAAQRLAEASNTKSSKSKSGTTMQLTRLGSLSVVAHAASIPAGPRPAAARPRRCPTRGSGSRSRAVRNRCPPAGVHPGDRARTRYCAPCATAIPRPASADTGLRSRRCADRCIPAAAGTSRSSVRCAKSHGTSHPWGVVPDPIAVPIQTSQSTRSTPSVVWCVRRSSVQSDDVSAPYAAFNSARGSGIRCPRCPNHSTWIPAAHRNVLDSGGAPQHCHRSTRTRPIGLD